MATPLYLSSLFSFCEGTVGTYAHPWRCVHTHHPHYSDVGSFVYGSRQKLGSKLGSKLTVEKKKSYKWSPSKNTSTFPHNHREGALFWKSILFGIFLTWQPWFQSHFGYLFPEDLHANTEHPKNTVLYWKDAHKVNCSLVIPFLGSVRGTKRGDWSVKNKEPLKPQALVSHETTHFIGADFASLDIFLSCHLKCFQRSSERKTGHQEGSKAHSGWALQFQIKYHPCFPKCNLDTQNKVSSCPNFCRLEKFWGEVFHEFISARSYLLNFHLDNILGARFQSYVDVRSFCFFVFKGRENRPIRVLKWIVCSPSLSFWSNVCRRGEKSSSCLYITKWPPEITPNYQKQSLRSALAIYVFGLSHGMQKWRLQAGCSECMG